MTRESPETELWKPVPIDSFSSIYEVSSLGRFRRTDSKRIIKGWARRVHCSLSKKPKYYLAVGLSRDGKTKSFSAHRLVCIAFHGQQPSPLHEVAHWDGDGLNAVASNLRWATKQENQQDSVRHGTKCRGEKSGKNKLRVTDVAMIRELCELGFKGRNIAKLWGVTPGNISHISLNRTWHYPASNPMQD